MSAYQQAVDNIRQRITSGELPPRCRLPSQLELAGEIGVSTHVVARAIARLRDEGYLWTLPSRGSYARPREDWPEHPNE
jgi:DNA-binding GntR family transcriptional regulator